MPADDYAIDPELRAPLAILPRTEYGMFDLSSIDTARATAQEMVEQVAALFVPDPSVTIDTESAERLDGPPVPIRLFRPASPDHRSCLLWFHPGGQVMGTAADDDYYLADLATRLGCVVAAVDYRLAPDSPAPAAAEDGYTAYQHLHRHAEESGLDPTAIGLAGASGGGAIAAATALLLRDRGAARPQFLSLSYAMLDDRNDTASSRQITDLGIWDRSANIAAWQAVLGERLGTPDLDGYSAPARATDLHGLPPAFLAVAELDVFRDENLDFAARLAAAGVPVEIHLYPGAYHAFDRLAPDSGLAHAFEHDWHRFLARHQPVR